MGERVILVEEAQTDSSNSINLGVQHLLRENSLKLYEETHNQNHTWAKYG